MVREGEWRMEVVQEGFLDQHARERLKREQEVLEKEREKNSGAAAEG